jgi:hypothetical protein
MSSHHLSQPFPLTLMIMRKLCFKLWLVSQSLSLLCLLKPQGMLSFSNQW